MSMVLVASIEFKLLDCHTFPEWPIFAELQKTECFTVRGAETKAHFLKNF
jgi:hypothetical protein